MVGGIHVRHLAAIALLVAEAALIVTFLAPAPSGAQFFFDDRFRFQSRRQHGPFDWFGPAPQQQLPQQVERPPPPVDYSRAPPPKKPDAKTESTVTTPILVLGDSMADWLAYGLELAYADSPEIGILRRHRTSSGLIRTETRSDPRGEYPDWPPAARELIASQKPKFVLMMIGINDRSRSISHVAPASRTAKPPPQRAEDAAALELDKSVPEKPGETPAAAPSETATPAGNRTLEFRTDAWSEAYIRRIDDTIAALKTSGVPVFWVGLPPLRGQKSNGDIPFLNDLYRSRADKAGIIYVDVWDGFVDEDGRYAQYGPDVQGQTRRLRSGDGVYFTQAGARKLAHYVERELQRWLSTRAPSVAAAVPEEPKSDSALPAPSRPGPHARPLAGPVIPLTTERGGETDDHLLGGDDRQPMSDAIAAKVLVRGETITAPAGRADDFVWPRRDVAPVGSDPVVAMTDLPMTPMVAQRGGATGTTGVAAPSGKGAATLQARAVPHHRATPRPPIYAYASSIYRPNWPNYRRPPAAQQFGFPSFFGGQSLFGGRW
ncbi:MAG TPA: SGNH family hydrolase [Xanthobacteraceae bacterium]|nr:SGNH family hydrolase [Xanthobacteraceae bacterium]